MRRRTLIHVDDQRAVFAVIRLAGDAVHAGQFAIHLLHDLLRQGELPILETSNGQTELFLLLPQLLTALQEPRHLLLIAFRVNIKLGLGTLTLEFLHRLDNNLALRSYLFLFPFCSLQLLQ